MMIPDVLVLAEDARFAQAAARGVSVRIKTLHPSELLDHLMSEPRPAGLILDIAALAPRAVRLLEALGNRNLLVPGVIAMLSPDSAALARAWVLSRYGVTVATEQAELASAIHSFRRLYDGTLGEYLIRELHVECAAGRALLRLLDSSTEALNMSVEDLARRCAISRTTLFARLTTAHLPPPAELQMLFRLHGAVRELQKGATSEEAAASADLSDARSLRRALRTRFDCGPREIRNMKSWQLVFAAWVSKASAQAITSRVA